MPDDIRQIDCRTAVRQLWDYLDDELSEERMREVRQHLQSCAACLPHAEFGKRFLDALHEARARQLMPSAAKSQVMKVLASAGFLP